MSDHRGKVLFITSYAPHGSGGSPNLLHNLLKHMQLRRIVFLTSSWNLNPPINEPLPCPTYYFDKAPSVHRAGSFVIAIWRIISAGLTLMREQEFDSVVMTSDGGQALIGGYYLAKRMRLPYSLIFFDPYMGNHHGLFPDLAAMVFERRLLKDALHVFVSGDALARTLRERVNREYVSLPVSVDAPKKAPNYPENRPRTFRILYAGAVYWAQVDTIRSFVAATQELRKVEFLVYSPQKEEELARMGVKGHHVRYGFLPKEDLLKLQNRMDLLYLPLTFSKKYRKVVELATASKICEYMTSGRPILVHAPTYAYIVNYARLGKFAHVLTTTDAEQIRQNVIMLMRDSAYRRRLAKNAWRIVKEHHNARRNSRILNDALCIN